ncbi:hypothetical protein SDC9_181407 [bioreactor metagenome]|uniref:Uncharacterized protein n=1 Tax=bioreactor metagenome TaxID=1076179 RepID=A0A645H4I2_9ZZZZ
MQPGERCQVTVFRRFIRRVLECHGDSTNDDRQNLACCSQRNRQRDTGTDALVTCNNQNGRDNGRQCGIRCNGSTDVHPAKGDHFQGTTDDNTGFHIPENGTNQRTGHQRAVELKFIEYRLHTRDTCDDEHQHNLKSGNLHCTSPIAIQT